MDSAGGELYDSCGIFSSHLGALDQCRNYEALTTGEEYTVVEDCSSYA